jgi:hypothetical protein
MTWSFSAHRTFRKCPRQWFYKQHVANHIAKDQLRHQAYVLSKMENIPAWRGKIVDSTISELIIPQLGYGRTITLQQANARADQLFAERQRTTSFYTTDGQPPSTEAFDEARRDVHLALENFYKAEQVWTILRRAERCMPQRALSFSHNGTTVRVVPDLITFHNGQPPTIFDWKVNNRALRDYRLQLVTGAIGLSRCKPHKDWAPGATNHAPHTITLLEVQLLTGQVKEHAVTEEDVQDAEDLISISADDMQLAVNNNPKAITPEALPSALEPSACQWCNFKTLCWRTTP